MAFDDLNEAMGDQEQEPEEVEEEPIADEVPEESTPDESATPPTSNSSADTGDLSEPWFEYTECRQSPIYAREETWEEFEDAVDLKVVRALREAGVRGEEKREIHDAVLELAADRPEEVAEIIVNKRSRNR